MPKQKILMSGVGGPDFPYIFNTLGKKYVIYGLDSNDMVRRTYPSQNVITVPLVKDDMYNTVVEKIIKEEGIDYYFPLIDEELPKAYDIASMCSGLKVILPSISFVKLCLNKYKLMSELKKKGISNVNTFFASHYEYQLDFPVFVKPIEGRGSRGAMVIQNKNQFDAYFQLEDYDKGDVIVQEYLDGDEYTVGVVVNNLNKLIAIVPKKIITKRGITQCGVTQRNPEIEQVCRKIVEQFHPCNPFNVQLKLTAKGVKVFEINPRFSTTSILSVEAGIDEYDLAIKFFDKKDVEYIDSFKEGLFIYRRWESIFCE